MPRHQTARKCLILLLAWAPAAWGQWDTNAWPAHEHPRAGRIHAENCYSALVERCHAASYSGTVTMPIAPAWYRFQRTILTNMKYVAMSIATNFVVPTNATESAALAYLNAKTNQPASNSFLLPTMTPADLAALASCSPDIYTNTPRRDLAGSTNGWDAMRKLITNMVFVSKLVSVHPFNVYYADNTDRGGDADWETAKAGADGSLIIRNGVSSSFIRQGYNGAGFIVDRNDPQFEFPFSLSSNIAPASIDAALALTYCIGPIYLYNTNNVYSTNIASILGYDQQGAWFTNAVETQGGSYGFQSIASSLDVSNLAAIAIIGTTNPPTLPWCDEPTDGANGNTIGIGIINGTSDWATFLLNFRSSYKFQ
jgi:hypothetical protein